METAKNVLATVRNELRRVRKYGLYNGNSEIELLPCKMNGFLIMKVVVTLYLVKTIKADYATFEKEKLCFLVFIKIYG